MKTFTRTAAVLVLATCSSLQGGPKVGIVLKGHTPFWDAVAAGAEAAAAEAKLDVIIKLPPTEDSISIQMQMIRGLANSDLQALIVAPSDPELAKGAVAPFAAGGAKIITIDAPLAQVNGSVCVGTDQTATGIAIGQLLATVTADADEVCIFRTSLANTAARERELGAMSALLKAHPGVVTHGDIYSGSEAPLALQRSHELLNKYPHAKAIFASTTTGTTAMLQALDEKNLTGTVKLVGFGLDPSPKIMEALQNGTLLGWVALMPRGIGQTAVRTAEAMLRGDAMPAAVHTDYILVTKGNVDDPKVKALIGL